MSQRRARGDRALTPDKQTLQQRTSRRRLLRPLPLPLLSIAPLAAPASLFAASRGSCDNFAALQPAWQEASSAARAPRPRGPAEMAHVNIYLLALFTCLMTACAQPDWVKEMLASGAPLPEGGADWAARFSAPAPGPEGASTCPPPGFKSVDDLDVDAYISKPWFVLAQVRSASGAAHRPQCRRSPLAACSLRRAPDRSRGT